MRPELTQIATAAQPLPYILRSAVGNETGAFLLTLPIIILGIFCGTGCTTAASRCVWAFARDGAVPGYEKLGIAKVNQKLGVPFNAMMASMVVQIALGAISIGSSAGFNAFNSSGVIFLTLSYVTPIAISLFMTKREKLVGARWNFGIFGVICNAVSVGELSPRKSSFHETRLLTNLTGWCAFAIPLFSMPSALPVTETSMNYASVVFVAGVVASAVWYAISGRKYYHGPAGGDVHITDGDLTSQQSPQS